MSRHGLRVVVEVHAGVIPGVPQPDRTRRWHIETEHWDSLAPQDRLEELAKLNGVAAGYASALQLQPDQVNWVRTEWVYL